MIPMLAGIDSGWVAGIATAFLAAGTVGGVIIDRRRTARRDRKEEAKDEAEAAKERAEAPAVQVVATTQAAEALARAAASLIEPFQRTIHEMTLEQGALREAVTISRAAEERCRVELAECRAELVVVRAELAGTKREVDETKRDAAGTKAKVREVTDKLGMEPPNGPEHDPA